MLQREIEESKRQDNIKIQKQYYITKKMEEFMDQYFSQMKNQMGIDVGEEIVQKEPDVDQIIKTLKPKNPSK